MIASTAKSIKRQMVTKRTAKTHEMRLEICTGFAEFGKSNHMVNQFYLIAWL